MIEKALRILVGPDWRLCWKGIPPKTWDSLSHWPENPLNPTKRLQWEAAMPQQLAHSSNWNSPPQESKSSQQRRTTKDKVLNPKISSSFSNLFKSFDLYLLQLQLEKQPISSWVEAEATNSPTTQVHMELVSGTIEADCLMETCQEKILSSKLEEKTLLKDVWNLCSHCPYVKDSFHTSGQPGFSDLSHGTIDVLAKGLQINVAAKLMPALRANPWYVRR